jgi:hypothetical protein
MSRCKVVSEPVTAGIAACEDSWKGKCSAFNINRHVIVEWFHSCLVSERFWIQISAGNPSILTYDLVVFFSPSGKILGE